MYISQKQGVYETHNNKKNNIRENLSEELEPLLFENHPNKDSLTIKKVAYYYAGKMLERYVNTGNKNDAMIVLSKHEKIDKKRYGIIINIFEDENQIKQQDKITINSIDNVKGMEGEKCLFILTNDLAAYLFNDNTAANFNCLISDYRWFKVGLILIIEFDIIIEYRLSSYNGNGRGETMMEISKKDWKLFRERLAEWQEYYMDRLTKEYIELLSDENKNASDRFWGLEKRIKQDKKHPGVSLEMQKQEAIWNIAYLHRTLRV